MENLCTGNTIDLFKLFSMVRETYSSHRNHFWNKFSVQDGENPYQSCIRVVGRTLEVFDDDKLIPVFGFGDATTHGELIKPPCSNPLEKSVFPFYPDRPCKTFNEGV